MSKPDFLGLTHLSKTARLLAQLLDRIRRGYREVWHATKTLAARLGCDPRTVQRAIKELVEAGLLILHRDYKKASRHRLELAWVEAPMNDKTVVESTTEMSFSSPPPLKNLPIEVSEDKPKRDDVDKGESSSSDPISHEQVKEVADLAEQKLGGGEMVRAKAAAMCQRYTPEWVKRALEVMSQRHRRNPWGFLFGCLRNWSDEGGPPPPPYRDPLAKPKRLKTDEEILAQLEAMGIGPGSKF